MAFSAKQSRQATEYIHVLALREKIQTMLLDGITVDSIHKVHHSDQYMVSGSLYFSNATEIVFFGECGNVDNLEATVRTAYHKVGTDYDTSENNWNMVRISTDRTNKVRDIKNDFNNRVNGKPLEILWIN